ncbi:hypothetical protein BGX26_000856 [Mortierella sp. AD094]|nr:hypothetical protein BGX26_000856 [Mortierella sp. AD094]
MALLSRSGRIILLLVLNVIMFLAEIIVGYKTGSLALIADAFHMLSDVLASVIALYAIRLAAKTEWQPTLSYGWQRAELLGALYNGVFLLALCFSILLDAIERFFKPEDINEPVLVLVVGGIGLASNLLGLVLFHDHGGHSHGHGHSHSHGHSHDHSHAKSERSAANDKTFSNLEKEVNSPGQGLHSLERISPLKEANLQNLQQLALEVRRQVEDENEESAETEGRASARPETVIVGLDESHDSAHHDNHAGHDQHSHGHSHDGKNGKQPSGEDLNMKGIFLHVLGDALGSVGVIITALFIWKTDFSWRFYMDPVVSLLITAIIVHSAVPLVKSASFILMQGVPVGVEIEEIRKDIKAVPDVISIHDLHIWQLTNTKMVASLHVLVTNQESFERVSRAVKTIMHRAGVHSTTIQPEFPGMNPYHPQAFITKNSLRLRKATSGEELLPGGEFISRTTSVGAYSDERLSEGYSPNEINASAAATTLGEIVVPEVQNVLDESNCTLLCVDGEQACDVGSCCTLPVKR